MKRVGPEDLSPDKLTGRVMTLSDLKEVVEHLMKIDEVDKESELRIGTMNFDGTCNAGPFIQGVAEAEGVLVFLVDARMTKEKSGFSLAPHGDN